MIGENSIFKNLYVEIPAGFFGIGKVNIYIYIYIYIILYIYHLAKMNYYIDGM